MPENETTETQGGQAQETTTPAETRREKFERERMSRRAALKKMGVTSALSVLALFSVDDLAHMVGRAMKQRAGDNQIAEVVARELREAGVVLAGTPSHRPCISDYDCSGCSGSGATGDCCGGSSDPNKCCSKNTTGQACYDCCLHAWGQDFGPGYFPCTKMCPEYA